jgi:hypothetical protein
VSRWFRPKSTGRRASVHLCALAPEYRETPGSTSGKTTQAGDPERVCVFERHSKRQPFFFLARGLQIESPLGMPHSKLMCKFPLSLSRISRMRNAGNSCGLILVFTTHLRATSNNLDSANARFGAYAIRDEQRRVPCVCPSFHTACMSPSSRCSHRTARALILLA